MFLKNISQETLDSYLVGTYESGEKLRMHIPGVNIIVRQFRTTVYQEVLDKLTEAGKLAVEKINPWLMVTMIDLEEFDKVICHMAKGNLFALFRKYITIQIIHCIVLPYQNRCLVSFPLKYTMNNVNVKVGNF